MIIVCEPQCKKFSHEKVNSGFLYSLRKAYPDEKIQFHADASHILAIQEILKKDNVLINEIEYIPITYYEIVGVRGFLSFYFLFKKMFNYTLSLGEEKIFFLSFSSPMLFIIKWLKKKPAYSSMKFALVLHSEFENINESPYSGELSAIYNGHKEKISLWSKFIRSNIFEFSYKIIKYISVRLKGKFCQYRSVFLSKIFPIKKILLWQYSKDYRYIALSSHIIDNAKKYLDLEKVNIFQITMPINYAAVFETPINDYPKFATFGYGNSAVLSNVVAKLSKRNIEDKYEIRIIGMDNRGTEGAKNVVHTSSGTPLTREEMEGYAIDIDFFLILYEKNRFHLSCSGSIMEALSYMKPIVYLDNDCVNAFNRKDSEIGVCCLTIDDVVDEMTLIIKNYTLDKKKTDVYRKNLLSLRNKYSVKHSSEQIIKAFTWDKWC